MSKTNDIVEFAFINGIVDIGQLNKEEKKELNRALKSGYLIETISYSFPLPKVCYIGNWFKFFNGGNSQNIENSFEGFEGQDRKNYYIE